MPWSALTEENVLDRLATEEQDEYEAAGEEPEPTPRLPGIITQVTNLIRDAIGQNSANYLGPDGTLPAGAIYHAATLCRQSLIGSQPTTEGETNPREREERAAWDYIRRIQDGKITFPNKEAPPREASGGVWGGKCLLEF